MRAASGLAVSLAVALPAVGCGRKLVTTSGVITLDGQPLGGAVVQFQPEGPGGDIATGTSEADGSFRLSTGGADGAAPGAYRVVVVKFDSSGKSKGKASLLPKRYASRDATPLQCTVPHDGPVAVELQRTPAARKP
jgi:hypothetical protein